MGLPPTISSLESLPPFLKLDTPISQAHKTGLGSSAALTTSLVFALLLHLGLIDADASQIQSPQALKLTHNLSQFVHCLAQGKIGSGFDVSSGVFGSQIYKRFSPQVLEPLMRDLNQVSLLEVLGPDSPAWNSEVSSFRLPPLIRLVLADVDAGSDTPSLVGRVLKWRQSNPEEANLIWNDLNLQNQELSKRLNKLTELFNQDSSGYRRAFQQLSRYPPMQWLQNTNDLEAEIIVARTLYSIHEVTESIRTRIRTMGKLADVPIEPQEQTAILNETTALPGVIGGGVPGAGGYDALWILIIDHENNSVLEDVQSLWSNTKSMRVTPLMASEGLGGDGLRVANVMHVVGLLDMLKDVGWDL